MVRELEEEATEDTRIVLTGTGAADGERLERALSEAASLAVHLLRSGTGVELAGAAGAVPLDRGRGQERRILTALALYVPPGRAAAPGSAADGRLREIAHQPGLRVMTHAAGPPDRALPPRRGRGVRALPGRVPRRARGPPGGGAPGGGLAPPAAVRRGAGRLAGGRLLVPLAALASVVDVAYLTDSVLDALVRLLLFLVLYKLATLQTVRDSRTVAFLAFFMLVAASGSAFGVGFLFAFVGFVGAAQLDRAPPAPGEREPRPARPAGAETVPTRHVTALAGAAAVAVFLVAGGLFFLLPRVGLATLPLRARLGQMITGFSERVELGSYGSILTDSNVVMRVHLPDEVQPDRYPNLRWRGVVLDTFDGQAWSVRYPRQTRLVRPSSGGFDVGLLRGSGLFLRQEIFLEPIGSEVVFAAPRVLRLSMPTSVLAMDDMGAVSARPPAPGSGTRSSPRWRAHRSGARRPRAPAPPLDAAQLERYLQLPGPGAGDPGARAAGRGPEPDASGDRRPRGGVPADPVPLHARHRAGEPAGSAPGVPLRPPRRPLRVLRGGDGGHAQEPRRPGAGRQRLPARGVEPVRPVLHRPVLRRALLGRGVSARSWAG